MCREFEEVVPGSTGPERTGENGRVGRGHDVGVTGRYPGGCTCPGTVYDKGDDPSLQRRSSFKRELRDLVFSRGMI